LRLSKSPGIVNRLFARKGSVGGLLQAGNKELSGINDVPGLKSPE